MKKIKKSVDNEFLIDFLSLKRMIKTTSVGFMHHIILHFSMKIYLCLCSFLLDTFFDMDDVYRLEHHNISSNDAKWLCHEKYVKALLLQVCSTHILLTFKAFNAIFCWKMCYTLFSPATISAPIYVERTHVSATLLPSNNKRTNLCWENFF